MDVKDGRNMKFGIETEQVEYKKSTSELKEGIVSIVSILNKHQNGKLYFGVKPDGTIIQNQISEKTLRDVSRTIYEQIKPSIYPAIQILNIEGIDIIEVDFSGQESPYSAYGRYYIRTADEDRELSSKELEKLVIARSYSHDWESKKTDYSIDDIDTEAFKRFYNLATNSGRLLEEEFNVENILKKLELLKEDRLTNAGYYLFSNKSPVELKMAIFATDQKLKFLDIKTTRGNIFNLIDEAQLYVEKNIRWEAKIEDSRRVEIPEIPLEALREVIVNGFAHAQYETSSNHEIAIFPSKITVFSPGEFFSDYTPDEYIDMDLPSMIRNKIITRVLYLYRALEQFGSGFKRINDTCKKNEIDFAFDASRIGFTFTFIRNVNNMSNSHLDSNYDKSDVTVIEKEVLKIINENNEITQTQIADRINRSLRMVKRYTSNLKEKGYLDRVGTDKSGSWVIKK